MVSGPDDVCRHDPSEEQPVNRPCSDEAIRAAFSRGCHRHSDVSVVTTIEDDSKLLAVSVASLLHLYALRSREEGRRQVTAWDSPFVPKFSVHDFLNAVLRKFHISPECCVVAFIYIDRFARAHPKFSITFTNIHRLLLTSVVVAAKFFEDYRYSNAVFANFFGLSAKQITGMELYLVRGLNWDLYVSQEECEECQSLMMQWGEQMPTPSEEQDVQVAGRKPRKATSRERAPRPQQVIRRF